MTLVIVLFGGLLFLIAAHVPIAVAIGGATLFAFLLSDISAITMVQRMYNSINSFTLMAIPFFMLAGAIMEVGGMSGRMIRFANSIVGTIAGGLAHVQILGTVLFSSLSGSSPATTTAVGSIMIPQMVKRGYPKEFAGAIQAVTGTVGTILPPSIPMVLFAVSGNVSIGRLFMAGIVPGIIYAGSFMILVIIMNKKWNFVDTSEVKFSWKEVFVSGADAIWALFVPIIILGGIYTGIFTPTEAGAVAAVYGLVVGVFVYREIKLHHFLEIFSKAAINVSMVLFIVANAGAFAWLLSIKGIAKSIGAWFTDFTDSQYIFLAMVILFLFVIGLFMECAATILMVTPILLPAALAMGIDPIHFGTVVIMILSLGMSTPPCGEDLFISASIAKVPFESLLKYTVYFTASALVVIFLVAFVPQISLFLPNLLYGT